MEVNLIKPFKPEKLMDVKLDFTKLVPLIGKSHQALSKYDGALRHLVNPNILLSPLTAKEATLSSRIEGTQATLTDVLKHDAESPEPVSEHRREDIFEVINYRKALLEASRMLEGKPIHLNMLKKLHEILLSGARGQNKSPGEFRKIQNYIGPAGCKEEHATYIPPSVPDMLVALDDWERFIHFEYSDVLIQMGLIHAQFEIIHPFLDGNGRLGRIIIPLFLYEKKYLNQPVFYLSEYLDANRSEYYEKLNNVTANGDWQKWVEFFLNAIIVQSNVNLKRVAKIMVLYDTMKHMIQETVKSRHGMMVLETLFNKPIINSTQFRDLTGINKPSTAFTILKKLEENNILDVISVGTGRSPSIYAFSDLLEIIDN